MPSRLIRFPAAAVLLLTCAMGGCAGDASEDVLTENEEALAAFDRGNAIWTAPTVNAAQRDSAVTLYERAVELDPEFLMAHVYLSGAQAWIHQNWDRSPERAQEALRSAQRAVELGPEVAEAHGALGGYYYRIAKDYDEALRHYERASALAPEDPAGLRMTGYVARRAGRWDDALGLLLRANEMLSTPASLSEVATTYRYMGLMDEAEASLRHALELEPERVDTQGALAWIPVYRSGDLTQVRSFLEENPSGYVGNRWWVAMATDDFEGALAALDMPGADPLSGQYGIQPRSLLRGLTLEGLGRSDEALASYQEAVATMEAMVDERPDDPRTHLALGLALAGAGRAEEGIVEGRLGLDLMPPERDAMIGAQSIGWLARIYAIAGEPDLAVDQLELLCDMPSSWTPAGVAIDPWFAGLRDHPRFLALVEGSATPPPA